VQKLTEPTTWMNELTVISLQDMAPDAVKGTLRDELVVQVRARGRLWGLLQWVDDRESEHDDFRRSPSLQTTGAATRLT
jgi:hypothetical protein